MGLQFACNNCGRIFSVDDNWAGKRAKCQGCGNVMRVPMLQPPAARRVAPPVSPQIEPFGEPGIPPFVLKLIGGILAVGLIACLCVAFAGRSKSDSTPVATVTHTPVARSENSSVASYDDVSAPIETAPGLQFPDRPPCRLTINLIQVFPMTIGGSGPGIPMQIRLYLPLGRHEPHSLPCVFIAPAGTRGVHGSALGSSDMPEHIPYGRFGFAVLAYELSGDVPNDSGDGTTFAQIKVPVRQYMAADGGLANARAAVAYVLAKVPEVDPDQLFAAGHSSAGTVALNLVAADHRFRAVAAYAPPTDLVAKWGSDLAKLDRLVPGAAAMAERLSPIRHVNDINCPVFLFHADDDSRVATEDVTQYAAALQAAGKTVQLRQVPTGDHYDSMIQHGIPGGITFFISHGAKPLRPVIP